MPFSGGNVGSDFRIEGRPEPEPGKEPSASNRSVTPEYFASMKIPLLKGRNFTEQDKRGQTGAAIINASLARLYFPNQDPIGQIISHVGANQNEGDPERWQIVGVVGDVHHSSLTKEASPELYLPYQQNSWGWGNFLVRTTVPPAGLVDSFRQEIKAVDKSVAITNVRPLTEAISATVTQTRFYTFLFGLFGAIGLMLTTDRCLQSYFIHRRSTDAGDWNSDGPWRISSTRRAHDSREGNWARSCWFGRRIVHFVLADSTDRKALVRSTADRSPYIWSCNTGLVVCCFARKLFART